MEKQDHHFIKKYGSHTLITLLEDFITEKRKQRIQAVLDNRLDSIQLAIESPADIHNALAAVRTSEALGITKVHIIAPQSDAIHARSITQGAIYWVDVHYYDHLSDFLAYITSENILLAGAMMNAEQPLASVPIEKPLCLFFGNEQRGLTKDAKKACHTTYHIPMVGMSESLNLSVSAAISLYDTTTRKRTLLHHPSDLSTEQRTHYQAQYYLNSVEPRLVMALLNKES